LKHNPDHYSAELISFRVILEGLIHNINTPLNLILGYVQQKQGTEPDCEILSKIYTAGLKIDNILKNAYKNVIQRTIFRRTSFCLDQWLDSEIKFIGNDLQCKHHSRIEYIRADASLPITTSPLLLAACFDMILIGMVGFDYRDLNEITVNAYTEGGGPYIGITCQDRPLMESNLQNIADQLREPVQILSEGDIRLSELFYISIQKSKSTIKVLIKIL